VGNPCRLYVLTAVLAVRLQIPNKRLESLRIGFVFGGSDFSLHDLEGFALLRAFPPPGLLRVSVI